MSNSPIKYAEHNAAKASAIAGARETGSGRALLKAVEIRRDELRAILEPNGGRSLSDGDIRTLLGEINALNWLLGLSGKLADILAKSAEGE